MLCKDATTNGKSTFVQLSTRVTQLFVPSVPLFQTVAALLPLDTCVPLMRAEYLMGCYGATRCASAIPTYRV
jgi:hypothetical protein